eukprot:CAMPEP_0184489726 /NCGR_PEP_ID=MMETSP0113_2-20130426/16208_1 /TAXON_ID=91329 /ORGANISM="Norrisiella sphaerica, Strain BC52" /LENGTH=254 /DNA_ID=CAMNT_0026873313 /DNA_START=353 /DNA_END=1117 /DNA_ORIENTATION=+
MRGGSSFSEQAIGSSAKVNTEAKATPTDTEIETSVNALTQITRRVKSALREAKEKDIALGSSCARASLEPLMKKLNGLQAADIGLEHPAIPKTFPEEAVGYIPVYEEEDFEIGIFAFPPGACIPLHDHPGMCVVSQVLYGSMGIKAYDIEKKSGTVTRQISKIVKAPCTEILFDDVGNIHEFKAGPDGCAILDVLTPPYNELDGRRCTYYQVVKPEGGEEGKPISLRPIKCPRWFQTYRLNPKMERVEVEKLDE